MPNEGTRIAESWCPPEELCGPVPRRTKWTSGGKVFLVFAFLISIFGLGVAAGIYAEAATDQRLAKDGKETDAVATRLWRRDGKTTHYHVAYEFSVGGQTERGMSELSRVRWLELSVGSHMRVKYVVSDPYISRPLAADTRLIPYWAPLVLMLVVLGLVALVVRPLRREQRLLSRGRPAAGVVNSIPSRRPAKFGRVYKYDFQVVDGSAVSGKTQTDRLMFQGSTVCVLYDPEDPRKNTIYPLRLVRIR